MALKHNYRFTFPLSLWHPSLGRCTVTSTSAWQQGLLPCKRNPGSSPGKNTPVSNHVRPALRGVTMEGKVGHNFPAPKSLRFVSEWPQVETWGFRAPSNLVTPLPALQHNRGETSKRTACDAAFHAAGCCESVSQLKVLNVMTATISVVEWDRQAQKGHEACTCRWSGRQQCNIKWHTNIPTTPKAWPDTKKLTSTNETFRKIFGDIDPFFRLTRLIATSWPLLNNTGPVRTGWRRERRQVVGPGMITHSGRGLFRSEDYGGSRKMPLPG